MDNPKKKGKADRDKVAGGEKYEVAYEAKKMNVTQAKVKEAIAAVGNNRKKIEEWIKTHR